MITGRSSGSGPSHMVGNGRLLVQWLDVFHTVGSLSVYIYIPCPGGSELDSGRIFQHPGLSNASFFIDCSAADTVRVLVQEPVQNCTRIPGHDSSRDWPWHGTSISEIPVARWARPAGYVGSWLFTPRLVSVSPGGKGTMCLISYAVLLVLQYSRIPRWMNQEITPNYSLSLQLNRLGFST